MTYGGAAKIVAYIANQLSNEHYQVHLLTYENNMIVPKIDPKVVHVNFQFIPPKIYGLRRIFELIKVRAVIAEIQPDAIISFLTYPNIISILATIGFDIPVIISERGDPYANRGWFTLFRDLIYKFADGYIFQTKGAMNYYSKSIQNKATVIPNPIILDDIPSRWMGNRDDIIVNTGRFELKQKRQDVLIKAFTSLADKYLGTKLVLFGDGEDEVEIIRIITELNLENRVVLAGITKNVYESIKRAKMFVLSSDYEGMPNALIEAMTIGLPCISTDYSPGGAADFITHMENGMLVKTGDVENLTKAMDFLLSNPQMAESMGHNASKIVNKLDPLLILNRWKKYIDTVIMNSKSYK
jgi:glycosyltransferase involved in cell wall biosynthesis